MEVDIQKLRIFAMTQRLKEIQTGKKKRVLIVGGRASALGKSLKLLGKESMVVSERMDKLSESMMKITPDFIENEDPFQLNGTKRKKFRKKNNRKTKNRRK